MSISIASALSSLPLAVANSPSTSPAPQPVPQPANDSADTVRLSLAQQAFNLYTQGQRVSQIANALNIPVNIVNQYLGLSSS